MKKHLLTIFSLLLVTVMLFSSCAVTDDVNTEATGDITVNDATDETMDGNTDEITDGTTDGGEKDLYVVRESYLPEDLSAQLKTIFEQQTAEFITYSYGSCPYVMRDVFTISNCRLLSISIPVSKTLSADADGNFQFTITVGFNYWHYIKNKPREVYTVLVSSEEYQLNENEENVNRWITVDLSEYDIVLKDIETLGFGNSTDTLIPAYIGNGDSTNAAQKLVNEKFPQMRGFISKMGLETDIGTSKGTLIYDFEWERTYESEEAYLAEVAAEAEYQRMLDTVRDEYAGKTLSVLGDSISTFDGYSNNTSYNSTIGSNAIYYPTNNGLYDHSDTYWYRLITDLEMDLCVNNAWSGSRVFDTARMPSRAGQLHRNNGEKPDVIIFYMGINDLHNDKTGEFGDLYKLLGSSTDKRSDAEKIEEWRAGVNADSFTTFEQAYALCLETMKANYPDAEIWCMTLNYNQDTRFDKNSLKGYNRCITALGEYYGCNVIDQTKGYIDNTNCVKYSCDGKGLHPNPAGHALMERYIIENFYENLK